MTANHPLQIKPLKFIKEPSGTWMVETVTGIYWVHPHPNGIVFEIIKEGVKINHYLSLEDAKQAAEEHYQKALAPALEVMVCKILKDSSGWDISECGTRYLFNMNTICLNCPYCGGLIKEMNE